MTVIGRDSNVPDDGDDTASIQPVLRTAIDSDNIVQARPASAPQHCGDASGDRCSGRMRQPWQWHELCPRNEAIPGPNFSVRRAHPELMHRFRARFFQGHGTHSQTSQCQSLLCLRVGNLLQWTNELKLGLTLQRPGYKNGIPGGRHTPAIPEACYSWRILIWIIHGMVLVRLDLVSKTVKVM